MYEEEKKRQLILKIFQDKLRKGESLETLSLGELVNQVNSELSRAEEVVDNIWKCSKCKQTFDYCWCNPSVN